MSPRPNRYGNVRPKCTKEDFQRLVKLLACSQVPVFSLLHHHFPNTSECSYQHFSNFEAREIAVAMSALLHNTGHTICPIISILSPVRVTILWKGINSSFKRLLLIHYIYKHIVSSVTSEAFSYFKPILLLQRSSHRLLGLHTCYFGSSQSVILCLPAIGFRVQGWNSNLCFGREFYQSSACNTRQIWMLCLRKRMDCNKLLPPISAFLFTALEVPDLLWDSGSVVLLYSTWKMLKVSFFWCFKFQFIVE